MNRTRNKRIKSFYGTSENAVKTQIWIAISVYLLVAIIKKRLNLEMSLYTFLQILSVTSFEKTHILQVLREFENLKQPDDYSKQLNLFEHHMKHILPIHGNTTATSVPTTYTIDFIMLLDLKI